MIHVNLDPFALAYFCSPLFGYVNLFSHMQSNRGADTLKMNYACVHDVPM